MAKKKKEQQIEAVDSLPKNAHILGAGEVVQQRITETMEINFMPYAMSVIMSRAIPEIDGFKPAHRKLLYTMYKMGLLTGARSKSANIVGRTMQLNPHGDAAIYETMVRLTRGYEALLLPFVDSKGNFGKAYSRDMAWAASRYTEAKLDPICGELFSEIDKDTVDFVDNYDSTMQEPTLLPVTFPTILANPTTGIAVGMASSICSLNLRGLCERTMALIRDESADPMDTLKAPDFIGGGRLIYDRAAIEEIYRTGRGSFKVRAKYTFDKKNNCIDVTEIPPTTTSEAIIEKIIERIKAGSIKEISDIRDETDKSGLKITIDLKRGIDADKLMQKLFKMTTLEDSFSCNFNVLIAGAPQTLGVADLLLEWIAYRTDCVKRRVYFDLTKAREKLHLLRGLEKILLDIDKAIKIVRETEEESEVVPNLMIGFRIDEQQAEYVAEIKLRHLNREYILKRLADIEDLEKKVQELEDILSSKAKVRRIIVDELRRVSQKYGKDRRTEILYEVELADEAQTEEVPAYPVTLFFTEQGYFKKITPQSLRMNAEHKLKEGDRILCTVETDNRAELLFFTNRQQVYKSRAADFDDTKASALGEYVASKLQMDDGEVPQYMAVTADYGGYMLYFFENGKVAKIPMSAYETKTNRKKLVKAISDKSPVAAFRQIAEDTELVIVSSAGRMLLFATGAISPKTTKDTAGVAVMTLKKGQRVLEVRDYVKGMFQKPYRYRTKNLPAAGALPSAEDAGEQMSLL